MKSSFDWFVMCICLAIIVGLCTLLYYTVHEQRADIQAACQPLGYVGGFMDKYSGNGCIGRNGERVLIQGLKR
jgi:hypothetical protein